MDEPDTDACSGHVQWSGKVWSMDEHDRPSSTIYSSCPQQPNLLLPFSHINDGICDCCDGTDEPNGMCEDVCDEVLKYERDAQLQKQHDFTRGYQRRQHALAEFAQFRDETDESIHQLEYTERPVLEMKNEGLTTQIIQLSMDANATYRKLLSGLVNQNRKSMEFVNALTLAELSELIVAVCHLTGEAHNSREDCLDLKDAASDVGYGWNDNLSTAHALRTADDYARFWFGDGTEEPNSNKQKKKNKNKNKHKHKNKNKSPSMDTIVVEETPHVPRLLFLSHAKNVMVEHLQPLIDEGKTTDDDEKDDQPDDDDDGDDDHEHRHDMNDDDDRDDDDDIGHNDDDDDLDRDFDEYVDDPVEDREEEPVSVEEEPESEQPAIDPLALQMVYNNFQDSITKIQNGVKVGKSARAMMDSFRELTEPDTKEVTVGLPAYTDSQTLRDDLALIAAELLILSNIQQEDLLEILYSILPEAQADTHLQNNPNECQADTDDIHKECASHSHKSNCVMSGPYMRNNIQIPPFNTVIKRHVRCQKRLKSPPVVTYLPGLSLDISIPASIPDGYLEYYQFQPRVEGHDFDNEKSFAALINEKETTQTTINNLQGMMRENLALLNDLQIQIDGFETEIGGDPNIYGQDGILYSLKGNCVSLETGGKYVYELCPFEKAHQRDIGKTSGGTNLGKWHGFEQSNNRPALVFKDGDKCWNGPKRSAWIFPICGPETKLISADEPETCKYEFVMETPIACDEIYARDHGLALE